MRKLRFVKKHFHFFRVWFFGENHDLRVEILMRRMEKFEQKAFDWFERALARQNNVLETSNRRIWSELAYAIIGAINACPAIFFSWTLIINFWKIFPSYSIARWELARSWLFVLEYKKELRWWRPSQLSCPKYIAEQSDQSFGGMKRQTLVICI